MDRSRYPENWQQISERIRFGRAAGHCEQCGVAHGALIVRDQNDKAGWLQWSETHKWWVDPWKMQPIDNLPDGYDFEYPTRVVLTTHHMGIAKPDGTPGDKHDKMDCRDENLMALCQRCHFIADIDIHVVEARKSRLRNKRKRILAAGQGELFGDDL